ncbi:MAG TPA: hypothetical protein V6C98_12740 [Thermosynechococcaceae cyanobacterium]
MGSLQVLALAGRGQSLWLSRPIRPSAALVIKGSTSVDFTGYRSKKAIIPVKLQCYNLLTYSNYA